MVAGLADGLSAADEPFLEAALDDRRKEVRLAASALLARLPSSRFAARMAGRILPLVRMPAGGRLQMGAPPEPDEAARRDGLPARTARPEQWIVQVAGATPLGSWPDPEELVAAAIDAGSEGLVAGWSLAAERQGDRVWARRLLGAGAPPTAGLVRLLGHPDGTAFLLAWLHRVHLGSAVDVLVGLPAPWPAPVTEAVMAALTRLVVTGDQSAPATAVRDALPRLARGADPECLDAVAGPAAALESLPDQKRPGARLFWGRGLASLNSVVHFRHAMHQEFQT
jgi:hypothetical protein